jgi:hypothetical protein
MSYGNRLLNWYVASTGAAAVDMQVALVTEWSRVGPKDRVSFQTAWGAGPVGAFSVQFSNVPSPVYNSTATTYPAAAYSAAPTQPSGTADNNIIAVDSIGEYAREVWTPSSGGTGVLPTTYVSHTESREE